MNLSTVRLVERLSDPFAPYSSDQEKPDVLAVNFSPLVSPCPGIALLSYPLLFHGRRSSVTYDSLRYSSIRGRRGVKQSQGKSITLKNVVCLVRRGRET